MIYGIQMVTVDQNSAATMFPYVWTFFASLILDRIGYADALLLNLCSTACAPCSSTSGLLDLVGIAREHQTSLRLWKALDAAMRDPLAASTGISGNILNNTRTYQEHII